MTWINSWTKGIIVAAIIGTIIEIILPNSKNKKYIKTVIGIYILFVIINPVINKISGKSIDLNNLIKTSYKQTSMKESKIDVNKYIDKTYLQNIKEDIKEKLKEKGYEIKNLEVQIETNDENNYGKINLLEIEIEKNNSEIVNKIEKVDILKDKPTSKNKISKEEIEQIKEFISELYQIDKEKINVGIA